MSCIPEHGRINCDICHRGPVTFDFTARTQGDWRITANPLAWGNPKGEILVLGFSKGPNALGALATKQHEDIPYAGQRHAVKKILTRIGVIPLDANIDALIADRAGRFAWGSLIRCTVERKEYGIWKGSGGGMLDRFVATPFGREVVGNCATRFLGDLPAETKLVVLFGLGTKNNYVTEAREVIQQASPGKTWRTVNDVAYTDGRVTFVHVEHFASQGRLIPDWCGEPNPKKGNAVSIRSRFGALANAATLEALAVRHA
ncbi:MULTISPECIES: hypothetical protein [unclassified Bradyrhizobium]|uniref:hypothetical protein n=1 Tax=unclassified Bradyrhizobium TaxID=2631580 RepID=UPI003396F3EF